MRPLAHLTTLLLRFGLALLLFTLGPSAAFAAPVTQSDDPVIVAVGDISNCSNMEDFYTSLLVDAIDGPLLLLGDNAYEVGSLQEYNDCYDPAYGRHKDRSYPAPGNHEYGTNGAEGYFTYFGDRATPLEPGCKRDCKGYYSFDVGTWHIVSLNSETPNNTGSEQELWLRADLAANPRTCTLAYWHRPTFSSGAHESGAAIDLFKVLYEYGADVVLVGHDHDYERFAPQSPSGELQYDRGVRQFVVGTGGALLRDFKFIQPNSEARNSETWGVLKMTLHPTSYDWEFIPMSGQSFTDAGTSDCVSTGEPLPAPPAPTTVTNEPELTQTSFVTSEPAATNAASPAGTYTIQSGDTLFAIGLKFNLSWTTIAQANGLSESSILQVGQVLQIPGAGSAAAATTTTVTTAPATTAPAATTATATTTTTVPATSSATPAVTAPASPAASGATPAVHTVVSGDTIFGIAAQYGLNWQELLTLNGLSENSVIQIGQQIKLK